MLIAFLIGFLCGLLALVAVQGFAAFWLLGRLRRKSAASEAPRPEATRDLDGERPLDFPCSKKGAIWILEPEKVPKVGADESPSKGLKEQKVKKNIIEVIPVKRYAEIKDQSLILSDSDGSKVTIRLLNCRVIAVSASNLSSRKWAKRYPIMLESKDNFIYNGSKMLLIYLDTSWEKESWCKALRLASAPDREKWHWYNKLGQDFNNYLASLNAEYPSFLKPSSFSAEALERTIRPDASSKVRHFLKKLAKKAAKSGLEGKVSLSSLSNRGERKTAALNDVPSSEGFMRSFSENHSSDYLHEVMQPASTSMSANLENKSMLPGLPESTSDEKFVNDEGTLCWNLLFSRLFFDAKRSVEINNLIKARIQRTLSNMRVPNYIGEVSCTRLDLGKLPPYLHKMRVFPMNLNEIWAMEVDIEYSGGILLDIETRLEVSAELQKAIIKTNTESNSEGEVDTDLLEGIEHFGNQLKSENNLAAGKDDKYEGDKADGLRQSKSGNWSSGYGSRWKAILHSIADQVSQVPLSLGIRITSLRGTLRLYIKPPPSDQLWFGFTTTPEIDWNLESAVGDRKITSSQIALLIGNRFKASIRESLVLPNCESVCIPWMLAEKDDWVPCKAAPFIWINQEAADTTGHELTVPKTEESINRSKTTATDPVDDTVENIKKVIHVQPLSQEPASDFSASQTTSDQSLPTDANEELRTPLLVPEVRGDLREENYSERNLELPKASSSRAVATVEEQNPVLPGEVKLRTGTREKMLGFKKRMGDKLEEKRRHIEEKSRHIVERMRENKKA